MIDWDKPIELETDPPKPARVVKLDLRDRKLPARVEADFHQNGRPVQHWVYADGTSCVAAEFGITARVRNVRPTEPAPDLAAELAEALRELRDNIAAASLARNENGKRVRAMADAALAKWEARK